jgi:hypothetical protein
MMSLLTFIFFSTWELYLSCSTPLTLLMNYLACLMHLLAFHVGFLHQGNLNFLAKSSSSCPTLRYDIGSNHSGGFPDDSFLDSSGNLLDFSTTKKTWTGACMVDFKLGAQLKKLILTCPSSYSTWQNLECARTNLFVHARDLTQKFGCQHYFPYA